MPEPAKLALPVVGAFAEACYRHSLAGELAGVLSHLQLAEDWQIAGMNVVGFLLQPHPGPYREPVK